MHSVESLLFGRARRGADDHPMARTRLHLHTPFSSSEWRLSPVCDLLRIILLATDIPSSVCVPRLPPKGEHVIDSVDKPPVHELLSQNTNAAFSVPAYQREYS